MPLLSLHGVCLTVVVHCSGIGGCGSQHSERARVDLPVSVQLPTWSAKGPETGRDCICSCFYLVDHLCFQEAKEQQTGEPTLESLGAFPLARSFVQ